MDKRLCGPVVGALLLLPNCALACDWTVSKRTDQMTDMQICTITSASARIGLSASQDGVAFVAMSNAPIDRQFLQVRVDDHELSPFPMTLDRLQTSETAHGSRYAKYFQAIG